MIKTGRTQVELGFLEMFTMRTATHYLKNNTNEVSITKIPFLVGRLIWTWYGEFMNTFCVSVILIEYF